MNFGQVITIEGIIATVTWQKEGNDFKAFTIKADGQNFKCAGALPFANVIAIVPLGKGMTKLQVEEYTRKKDRASSNGGEKEVPDDEADF